MVEKINKEIKDLKELNLKFNSIKEFVSKIVEYFEIENYSLGKTINYHEKEYQINIKLNTNKKFKYDYNLQVDFNRNKKILVLECKEIEKPITENDKNFIVNRAVNIFNMDEFTLNFIIKDNMKRKNSKLVLEKNKEILEIIKSLTSNKK